MSISLQENINNKIDTLTYNLYKIEQKILKFEKLARERWYNIYEPLLHSDINDNLIKYKTLDEYYMHAISKNKYRDLINNKYIIETELHFIYSIGTQV